MERELPILLRHKRSLVQKKQQKSMSSNQKFIVNKEDEDIKTCSSFNRTNSVLLTAETTNLNKNNEDFLMLKTQPPENLNFLTDISESSDSKKKSNSLSLFNEIIGKMKSFKVQKGAQLESTINYMLKRYDKNKRQYYDFLQEKDLLTLRFLIQILYDKLEEKQSGNKQEIEALEQKILDSQRNSSVLQDEMLEKNIVINTLSTKFYILTQRTKDFRWLINETKGELKKLVKEDRGLNYAEKTTFENLLKEFELLDKKMQDFDSDISQEPPSDTLSRNKEDLSFMRKFDKSRKNIQENFKTFFDESNKPTLNNIKNTRNEDLLAKELKYYFY